jgi:hypothetical protein
MGAERKSGPKGFDQSGARVYTQTTGDGALAELDPSVSPRLGGHTHVYE